MDRNSIIGIILIAAVVGVWIFLQSGNRRDVTPETTKQKREQQDSAAAVVETSAPSAASLVSTAQQPERVLTVETNVLRLRLTSKGGMVRSWALKHYKPWYKNVDTAAVVDLVQPGSSELGFSFRASNGVKVQAKDLHFEWQTKDSAVRVSSGATARIVGRATLAGGGVIERMYTLNGDSYAVQTSLVLDSLDNVITPANRNIILEWKNGLRYQEGSSVDESGTAMAMARVGDEIDEYDASVYSGQEERMRSGRIEWLATRTKYFALALIPPQGFDGTAIYSGVKVGYDAAHPDWFTERYKLSFKLPYKGGRTSHSMTVFGGPMQYDTLQTYGLTDVMNFGFKWIVKPIGEYFMLPMLRLVHSGIANWGIAIIVFSVIMKVLLYPLSIQQMKSAQKMQLLAPLMTSIREKYKDDMQTQQQEMMKLYSEYGINPAGGCLPLLLQMPFLYALYAVLNYNIELRQAMFLPVWLTDLSIPDVIVDIGFKIPLFGVDKFSGLALLMGATLFVQQKQAITDPRQQGMVYIMPVMFTLMFSSLPAGLNLYYFMFNIMGIGQQIYMNKFARNRPTLEQLRSMPKKEGWLQRKMREAQEMAAAQGRSIPGQPNPSQRIPNNPKKKPKKR